MIWKLSLRSKLLGAFILLGITVLVIAYVGWQSNSRLIKDITSIEDTVDSLVGIWKVHDGLLQTAYAEHVLMNSRTNQEHRKKIWGNIVNSISLIDEGLREYESTSHLAEEARLYNNLLVI
jgi:hypothetical protein